MARQVTAGTTGGTGLATATIPVADPPPAGSSRVVVSRSLVTLPFGAGSSVRAEQRSCPGACVGNRIRRRARCRWNRRVVATRASRASRASIASEPSCTDITTTSAAPTNQDPERHDRRMCPHVSADARGQPFGQRDPPETAIGATGLPSGRTGTGIIDASAAAAARCTERSKRRPGPPRRGRRWHASPDSGDRVGPVGQRGKRIRPASPVILPIRMHELHEQPETLLDRLRPTLPARGPGSDTASRPGERTRAARTGGRNLQRAGRARLVQRGIGELDPSSERELQNDVAVAGGALRRRASPRKRDGSR